MKHSVSLKARYTASEGRQCSRRANRARPCGQMMGSLFLDGQLTKGFTGFLKDLGRTAVEGPA